MSFIKTTSRRIVFPTVVALGLEKIFLSLSENKCLILNYHGVVKNLNLELSRNHLSLKQFIQHLSYFEKNFDVIGIDEAFDFYRKNVKPKRKSIVITFDDGYLNNLTNALPELLQRNFPATFFVTAQLISNTNECLWYDQLDLLAVKVPFEKLASTLKSNYPTVEKLTSYSTLKEHIKNLDAAGKRSFLDALNNVTEFHEVIYSSDPEYWKMLDATQLRNLASSKGVEIGSHSVSHSNLDRLNEDQIRNELVNSKSILENTINKTVDSIAFPDGAYNQLVKKLSIETGYKKLLAVNYHLQEDKSDPFILPRFSISNTTTFESVMINVNRAFKRLGY